MSHLIYATKSHNLFYVGLFMFFLVIGDVAQREASDHAVKSRALDFTYLRGYVVISD